MTGPDASSSELVSHVIRELGMAVLEATSDGDLRLLGAGAPAWFDACFGSAETLLERSAVLEDFVTGAAREYWQSGAAEGKSVPLQSGLWEETSDKGESHYFEAQALTRGSTRLLVIACADERHRQETTWMQRSHDEALQQRRLAKEREKKEILLDCIVHDLSSPLSTILMTVQHVSRNLKNAKQRAALDQAMSQAQRQRNLIRSISDVFSSDLSAFEKAIMLGEGGADIGKVARTMLAAQEAAAKEKSVHIEAQIAEGVEHVVGDDDHLARVFDNLLSNALRHSPDGGKIRLRIEPEERCLRVAIEDDGPGVPPEEADRIFRPFSQGRGKNVGQSGLGLYFCRMVIELWGGSLGVEEAEPTGAVFWFRLPLAEKKEADAEHE